MRFALTAEQQQFAGSMHDMLAAADVPGIVRGWGKGESSVALWPRLAELGVTALAVPERWDGLAAHPVDLVVAFEELGYHALPGPLVESLAAVPTLLTELGEEGLCRRWLPGLAAGAIVATLAYPPCVPYALDADLADAVFLVDSETVRLAQPVDGALSSVDISRRLFAVDGAAVLASGPSVRSAAARAFDVGALACAAQLLGAGRALLKMATSYAGQRHQFGRSIGQFQAVKHQLADVMVGMELARPLLYGAAIGLAERSHTASRDVSSAKIACGRAAYRAARTALQVHGAIGYTREHNLGLWLTKVRALVSAWGTQAHHYTRVAVALAQSGDPGERRARGAAGHCAGTVDAEVRP